MYDLNLEPDSLVSAPVFMFGLSGGVYACLVFSLNTDTGFVEPTETKWVEKILNTDAVVHIEPVTNGFIVSVSSIANKTANSYVYDGDFYNLSKNIEGFLYYEQQFTKEYEPLDWADYDVATAYKLLNPEE